MSDGKEIYTRPREKVRALIRGLHYGLIAIVQATRKTGGCNYYINIFIFYFLLQGFESKPGL